MENGYEIIQIDEQTWSIENGFVRFFLLAGEEKAILIDSGFDLQGVRELARKILSDAGLTMEPELINTHGDGDHCFGNREFEWFYMHEGDWDLYRRNFDANADIRPVREGDIIDLGNRPLEIIEIPGHTYGSIAILDVSRRVLYAGDSVQTGEIFLFGEHRNLDDFPAGLMKLDEMTDRFDVIHSSHDELKVEPELIGDIFDACESLFHGEIEPEEVEVHGCLVHAYDGGAATFLIDRFRTFIDADE